MAQSATKRRQNKRNGRLLGIPPPPQPVANPDKVKKKKKNRKWRPMAYVKRELREAEKEEEEEANRDLREAWAQEDSGTEEREAKQKRQQDVEEEGEEGWDGDGMGGDGEQGNVEDEVEGEEPPFEINDEILRPTQYLPFDSFPPYEELCVISRNSTRWTQEVLGARIGVAQQVGRQFVLLTQGRPDLTFDKWYEYSGGEERENRMFRLSTIMMHTNTNPSHRQLGGFKHIWKLEYNRDWQHWWLNIRDPNTKRILLLIRGLDGFITNSDYLQELQTTASDQGIRITIVFYLDDQGFFTFPIDLQRLLSDDTEQLQYLRTRLARIAAARQFDGDGREFQSEWAQNYRSEVKAGRNQIQHLGLTAAQQSTAPTFTASASTASAFTASASTASASTASASTTRSETWVEGSGCPEPMCAGEKWKFTRVNDLRKHYKTRHTDPKIIYRCETCVTRNGPFGTRARDDHISRGHVVVPVGNPDYSNVAKCPTPVTRFIR